jgi:hypothetical protein
LKLPDASLDINPGSHDTIQRIHTVDDLLANDRKIDVVKKKERGAWW